MVDNWKVSEFVPEAFTYTSSGNGLPSDINKRPVPIPSIEDAGV